MSVASTSSVLVENGSQMDPTNGVPLPISPYERNNRYFEGSTSRRSNGASASVDEERCPSPVERDRHKELMEEISKRYRVDLRPRMNQLRFTKTFNGYKISTDFLKPRDDNPFVSFSCRPPPEVGASKYLKKMVFTPQLTDIRAFTPPIEIGFLRLQVAVGFDWGRRSWLASWRVRTKWTRNSKIHRKLPVFQKDRYELTSHWNIRQELPQMGGQIGRGQSSVDHDIGKFQLDLNRMKFSVKL